MGNWLSEHTHDTLRWCNQPCENFDHGTFASTVRAEKAESFSTIHNKADVVYRDQAFIDFAQTFNFYSRDYIFISHQRPVLSGCAAN